MLTTIQIREFSSECRRYTDQGSRFDGLASEYDAWFDGEGELISRIEVEAFRSVLRSLPKPWLEIGVGSGWFAQELGIENGVDPSTRLLQMTRKRGVNTFLGKGGIRCLTQNFSARFLSSSPFQCPGEVCYAEYPVAGYFPNVSLMVLVDSNNQLLT